MDQKSFALVGDVVFDHGVEGGVESVSYTHLDVYKRQVVDDAGFLALGEQLGVHKASRPNDHVGRAQKARPAQRDKVGGARARSLIHI